MGRKKEVTRTRTFDVPSALMVDFAEVIVDNDLAISIENYDHDEDEITIEIDYEADQKDLMHELQDKIDDYYDEEEDD
jgi:hypothetical protein